MIWGVDISNLNGTPDRYSGLAEYQAAEFVIVQAIPRPAPNGIAAQQLRAAKADGKALGIYSWLWHDPSWRLDPDVATDQRLRLATVPDDVELDMRPWLDVEDNQSTGWQAVTIQQRVDDVNHALETLDTWAAQRGLPEAGIYWSDYFIGLLFGGRNYWPERKQWKAHYEIAPGSLIGGTVVAHQFASTPIDQNVMLESELVSVSAPAGDPSAADFRQALSYLSHDVMQPLRGYKLARVKTAVAEVDRVAAQYGAV